MLRLKEITDVRKKPVCFCGRPLTGEFCEIHGTDIRVDPIFVDSFFQVTDLDGKSLFDRELHVSFPQNMFLRLFKKNLDDMHDEIIYDVKITPRKTKEIIFEFIKDFLGELDAETSFFGYIPFRWLQIRRSGITIYYLFRFEIISSDMIRFYFTVLPLRRLSDYISWRLNHCRGNIQNVQRSLLTNRSTVLTSNGEVRKVIAIQWDSNKALPSEIILQDSKKNSTTSELSSRIYQGRDHFFLGQRTENEMVSGLKDMAYQFVNNFLRYLRFQSITGNCKKIKDQIKFSKFIGKFIKPNVHFLQQVGEKQNRIILENDLLTNLTGTPQICQSRALLIVSCSATKSSQVKPIPALLRYLGKTFLFLKHFLTKSWPTHVDLLIVSARFGLVKPKEPIPFYEQQLTPETISETERLIDEQTNKLEFAKYIECFLNLPQIYLKAIKSLETVLQNITCSIKKAVENQTKRNIAMIRWLFEQVNNFAKKGIEALHD
jgi:hypothetical protein